MPECSARRHVPEGFLSFVLLSVVRISNTLVCVPGKAAEKAKESLAAAGGAAQRVVEDPRVIKTAAERTAGKQTTLLLEPDFDCDRRLLLVVGVLQG